MGNVYKARHRRLKRIVALKVLKPDYMRNAESARRFAREMEAVGRVSHGNIVSAMDDVISLGVMGALMGGAFSAAVSEGRGAFPAILKAMNEAEQPAEQISDDSKDADFDNTPAEEPRKEKDA